ncbi:MAG: hypothetical protein ACLP7Q_26840 [Isosphaeraceae bacterium]
MNGFTVKRAQWIALVLVAFAIAGVSAGHRGAYAATIKEDSLARREAKAFASWTPFLSAGVHTWATRHAPAFSPAVESTIWTLLKSDSRSQAIGDPMIEYLLWRRSLDPTRFASYHPNLSPALARLLTTPTLPNNAPPPTFTPEPQTTTLPQTSTSPQTSAILSPQTVSPPPSSSSPQQIAPAAIPEPGTLVLAICMTGWAVWHRRKLHARSS